MPARNTSSPATQADLAAARGELKADIKSVRDELKADIKSVRDELKTDIKIVRDELKMDIHRLAKAQIETQARVARIETTMANKSDIERILSAIDTFAKKGESYDRKSFRHGDMLQNHEVKLRDHDKRLATLETKR